MDHFSLPIKGYFLANHVKGCNQIFASINEAMSACIAYNGGGITSISLDKVEGWEVRASSQLKKSPFNEISYLCLDKTKVHSREIF